MVITLFDVCFMKWTVNKLDFWYSVRLENVEKFQRINLKGK